MEVDVSDKLKARISNRERSIMTFTAAEMDGLFLLDKWGKQVTALAAYTEHSVTRGRSSGIYDCHLGEGSIKKLKTMAAGSLE